MNEDKPGREAREVMSPVGVRCDLCQEFVGRSHISLTIIQIPGRLVRHANVCTACADEVGEAAGVRTR